LLSSFLARESLIKKKLSKRQVHLETNVGVSGKFNGKMLSRFSVKLKMFFYIYQAVKEIELKKLSLSKHDT